MIGVWNMISFSMIISLKIARGLYSAMAYIRKNTVKRKRNINVIVLVTVLLLHIFLGVLEWRKNKRA